MSEHRIKLIITFAVLALFSVPLATAQTALPPERTPEPPAPSSSPSTERPHAGRPADSTGPNSERATEEPTAPAATAAALPVDATTESAIPVETRASVTLNPAAASADSSNARVEVVRADPAAEQHSIEKLKGQRLRDGSGAELGKIHDFIVDADTGDIIHVVISSGGVLGVGDKLRLIPCAGLEPSAVEGFRLQSDKAHFDAMPTISEKDLKAGRFATKEMSGQSRSTDTASGGVRNPHNFVRASQLNDKAVRADDHAVGEIENVIIDFSERKAFALIDVDRAFAREGGRYIVPFAKLQIRSAEDSKIASSLLRSDFAGAATSSVRVDAPSNAVAAVSASTSTATPPTDTGTVAGGEVSRPETETPSVADPQATRLATSTASSPSTVSTEKTISAETSRATEGEPSAVAATSSPVPPSVSSNDEQLTPTGRTSADQNSGSSVAALAIRQALDGDPEMAKQKVEVRTKILLRGTVASEEAKKRVEELARQAAKNAEVENHITVEPN